MKVTRAERVRQVRELRAAGLTNTEVATRLGLSYGMVHSYLHDPDGSRDRERKRRAAGTCADCGGPTFNGGSRPPLRCSACEKIRISREKYWTRERVLEEIARFVAENGRRPSSSEWLGGKHGRSGDGFPYSSTVLDLFGTWNAAMEAAGLGVNKPGQYIVRSRSTRPDLSTIEGVAELLRRESPWGVAPSTRRSPLYSRVRRLGYSWEEACALAGVRPRNIGRY